jgi:hypothetical protein
MIFQILVHRMKNPGDKPNQMLVTRIKKGDDAKEVRVRNPSEETYAAQIAALIFHTIH